MNATERIDALTAKLSDDFNSIRNSPFMYRSDFAGAYVKDENLHVILVNNADINHYRNVFDDDSVVYHYTDVSFVDLIETRNLLRDYYDRFNIAAAAIIDELSVIELTVIDKKSITEIIKFLKERNFTDDFINKHLVFVIGEFALFDDE